METPSAAPRSPLWQTLPEKMLVMSMHHLARLLLLFRGEQPSPPKSTEQALDALLMHLALVQVTPDSRHGWVRVELTREGRDLVNSLLELTVGPLHPAEPEPAPPPAPSPSAPRKQRATLSLVPSSSCAPVAGSAPTLPR